jgi:hypothetical protein
MLKKIINKLIYIRVTEYDIGLCERKLCVHPVVYIILITALLIGGYFAL